MFVGDVDGGRDYDEVIQIHMGDHTHASKDGHDGVGHSLHVATAGPGSEGHSHIYKIVPVDGQQWPVQGAGLEVLVRPGHVDGKHASGGPEFQYTSDDSVHGWQAMAICKAHDCVFANIAVTEEFLGKVKSVMTLRFDVSDFGLVMIGETWHHSSKGGLSNGPMSPPSDISLSTKESTWSGN